MNISDKEYYVRCCSAIHDKLLIINILLSVFDCPFDYFEKIGKPYDGVESTLIAGAGNPLYPPLINVLNFCRRHGSSVD
jgi:hypothetical protein